MNPTEIKGDVRAAGAAGGSHSADARLRAAGFSIHARPRGGPAVWRRGGRVYAQREAERLALAEARKPRPAGQIP